MALILRTTQTLLKKTNRVAATQLPSHLCLLRKSKFPIVVDPCRSYLISSVPIPLCLQKRYHTLALVFLCTTQTLLEKTVAESPLCLLSKSSLPHYTCHGGTHDKEHGSSHGFLAGGLQGGVSQGVERGLPELVQWGGQQHWMFESM